MEKTQNPERPVRKTVRLKNHDYSTPGYYFITICTRNKRKLLGEIVGTLPDGPEIRFSVCGEIARRRLEIMKDFYEDIKIDKYVVMPNHIHMILHLTGHFEESGKSEPVNTKVSRFVGTFKRFCNREYGENIWQDRSYDHVIRGELDYENIWNYIDTNPAKWAEDRFYVE